MTLVLALHRGEQVLVLQGRTAAMVAALVTHQDRINAAGPLGKVVLNYSERYVVPILEESLGKHDLRAA